MLKKRKTIISFLVLAAFALLCVRPAHAAGTVPLQDVYCSDGSCSTCSALASLIAWNWASNPSIVVTSSLSGTYCILYDRGTPFRTLSPLYGQTCPSNSTGTTTCTCDAGFQPDTAGSSCVPVPAGTPQQQAADAAKAAATAAGLSPQAAQAASDAVMASSATDPATLAGVGKAAGLAYDGAVVNSLPAATAHDVAMAAGTMVTNGVSNGSTVNNSTLAAVQASLAISAAYQNQAATGTPPSMAQTAANIAAGVATAAAIGLAMAGAAPIAVTTAGAIALHAAILGVALDPANANQNSAVQSAGAAAIQSGASPLQVTLAVQAASTASTSATTPAVAAIGGAAATQVLTAPLPSWSVTSTDAINLQAAIAASTAAESAGAASGTPTQIQAAAYAAANAIHSGQSTTTAATTGLAASVGVAAGLSSNQAQAAATAAGVAVSNGTAPAAAITQGVAGVGVGGATEVTAQKILDAMNGSGVNPLSLPNPSGWNIAEVPLPHQSDFTISAPSVSALPVGGACVPFSVTLSGNVVTWDECAFITVMQPMVNWFIVALGVSTGIWRILGRRQEEA